MTLIQGILMKQPTAVQCPRCRTKFKPKVFPSVRSDIGPEINCPGCGRGYHYDEESDGFISDRPLMILKSSQTKKLTPTEPKTNTVEETMVRVSGEGQEILS